MGAIKFSLEDGGSFLSDDKETAIPPWATLRVLEEASRQFEKIETAQYYGINQNEAEKIVDEISTTVRASWERLANEYGLSRGALRKCAPPFPLVTHNQAPSFWEN